jgi:hypothetical protein
VLRVCVSDRRPAVLPQGVASLSLVKPPDRQRFTTCSFALPRSEQAPLLLAPRAPVQLGFPATDNVVVVLLQPATPRFEESRHKLGTIIATKSRRK